MSTSAFKLIIMIVFVAHGIGHAVPLLAAFSFILTGEVNTKPKLKVSHTIDNTIVQSGDTLHGTLILENVGIETLKIINVKSSCGCTTFHLYDQFIEVGKEIILPFNIDTDGKLGRIDKTITIYTNDKDSPWIEHIIFHAVSSEDDKIESQKIFETPCASCHIDPASGKEHKALFKAVCDMCHHAEDLYTISSDSLYKTIVDGSEEIGMPAYKNYLSNKQIQTLISYLIDVNNK